MLLRKFPRILGILGRFFRTAVTRQSGEECSPGPGMTGGEPESCLLEPCVLDPTRPQPRVVIVGAGVAGLSAAQRLAHCGLDNITVLEATDRPGGRVYSCWLGDAVVELGAQWLLGGSPANSVYTLAAREGLLTCPPCPPDVPAPAPRADPLFCTSDGRAVDPPLARAAIHTFSLIESQAQALFSLTSGQPHGALLNFMHKRIQQEVLRYPEEQRYEVAAALHGLCNGLRCWTGADLANVSADQYGSAIRVPGGNVRIPLGFVGVLAPLLRDLPECSIRYCKVVEKINWSGATGKEGGDARAVVRTCDGDEYPADYVIVTVSLGVLKSNLESMFNPCLPTEKIEAIKGLGYGSINKVFMEYERPFWAPGGGALQFAWNPDELLKRDDWVKGIGFVEEVPGSRSVLSVWVSGDEATCTETLDEVALADGITRVLRRFTGDPSLPYPAQMLRSRWNTDHNFRGAVSYLGLDSNVGQQCDLSAPVPTPCSTEEATLLFAGEATCPGHYGTVHGARLSGLREAERVLALTRKYGGPPAATKQICG